VDDRAGEGTTLNNIGAIYQALGQYPQALEQYQQALAISRAVDDRASEGRALNNIAVIYANLGQYPQALEQLHQALAINREMNARASEGTTLINIGMVYWAQEQHPQALEQLQQALLISREVNDRAAEGATLTNMGIVYWYLGQYPQALEHYQQALVVNQEVGAPDAEGTTLSNMGAVQFLSGQFTVATETLFRAIEVRESLRAPELSDASKIALIDTQNNTYDFLQQALIAQNKTETALEVAERGRARAFVELLAQQTSPEVPSQSIAVSAPSIAEIKQVAREQNATLVEYSITYEPVRIEGGIEWQQSKLYIWVVKPTGEVAFRQVDLTASNATLSAMVRQGRQSINARGRDSAPLPPPQTEGQPRQPQRPFPYLQGLYQMLIEPIADLLPTNPEDHVVFIPQGELFSVPFPALQDANGRYLIENHTIMTAPSIQVLSLTRRSQQTPSIDSSQALIVGNPTMPMIPTLPPNPPRQLSALPESGREAIAIAEQFNTQPLLGDAATETVVVQRMTSAQIIHLATHGMLDYGDPQASGVRDFPGAIALAPSAQDDGLLTSSEIFNLKLNADLVVLSACDTGLGRMSADGVIGLSRSLLSAGASSVIVSLWKVNDGTTNALMTEFYQQLEQQPDKAQALRQAMLKTMQEYRNPGAWAAFTLIGEPE
jgi:CHAT domain-containing protein/Flp pilus assembly protein TadD